MILFFITVYYLHSRPSFRYIALATFNSIHYLCFDFHVFDLVEDFLPGKMNVSFQCKPGADGESQDEGVSHFGGSHVDLPSLVYLLVESLIDRVARSQSEADQPQLGRERQLEPVVLFHQLSKIFRKFYLNNEITEC